MNLNQKSSLFQRGKSALLAGILSASLLVVPATQAQDATPPAATPSASPEATVAEEPVVTNLMTTQIDELPPAPFTVRMLRITLQPGAITPMHSHHGPEIDMIETGEITIRSMGDAPITRADGTEEISTGDEVTLTEGDLVHFPAEVGQRFENTGDEPAEMLSSVIIPVGPDYVNERITWFDGEPNLEGVTYQKLGDGLVQDMEQQSAEWTIDSVELPPGVAMPALEGVSMITPVEGNLSFSIDSGQVQITRADSNMLQPNAVLGTSVSLDNADAAFFPNGVESTPRDNEDQPLTLLMMDINPAEGTPEEAATLTFNEGDGTIAGGSSEPEPQFATTNAGDVNMRDQPSVEGEVVDQLAEGVELEVLDGPVEAEEWTWYQVRVTAEGGSEGWVASDFLNGLAPTAEEETTGDGTATETDEPAAEEDTASTPESASAGEFPVDSTVITTEEGVRLRPEPTTDTEALDALPVGSELTVIGEQVEDGDFIWIQVERADDGLQGWVVTDFLEATPADGEGTDETDETEEAEDEG